MESDSNITAVGAASPRQFFWAKASYFFFFAAGAALFPYLALHYENLGFTGRQIGLLAAISPLMSMIGAPLWSGLADLTQRHKTLLVVAISGAAAGYLALAVADQFFWMLLCVAFAAFVGGPTMSLIDSTVMEMLGPRRDDYGKMRLWGAVGWGIAAPLVGLFVESVGLIVAFIGYAVLQVFNLLSGLQLPITSRPSTSNFRRDLKVLLGNPQWLGFLFVAFIGGVGMTAVHSFLFLHMRHLGASGALMGISLTVATISELPVMGYGDRLLKRFGSRGLFSLGIAMYAVRMIGFALIPAAWMALPLQLLHGPGFSALWVAGVSYADKSAPEGMGATAQGMFSAVIFGIGAAVGSLVNGWLYETVGSAAMFGWMGSTLLAAMVIYYQYTRRSRMRHTVTAISGQ